MVVFFLFFEWRCVIYYNDIDLKIILISMVSCQKGPTRHAYAWQIGPFWQDTLNLWFASWWPTQLNWEEAGQIISAEEAIKFNLWDCLEVSTDPQGQLEIGAHPSTG